MKKQVTALINYKAQDIQDKIFMKMSADRKIEIGSQLWKMAKKIVGNKVNYASKRRKSKRSFGQYR